VFVITADQIGSRNGPDLAGEARDLIENRYGRSLSLPADRTAGDEIQMLTEDAATTLAIVLGLTREKVWSVGVGSGSVRTPLPEATREATGSAFYAAREAVERAKKKNPTRFALRTGAQAEEEITRGIWPTAQDAEALIDLLLATRTRRSEAGWELYDLLESGLTQQEAAARLGITPPSASSRARAADLKIERLSIGALTRLLGTLDEQTTTNGTD
jgi:predicted XRE-type DNA-binding protein